MTKTKFFANPQTMQELKTQYRDLAMKHHPDRPGGNKENMQAINAEYEQLFNELPRANKAEQKEQATQYPDIINQIIYMQDVEIEVCGTWVWLWGETKPHKDYLKEIGFYWAPKKRAWYWRPYKYHKKSKKRGELTLDEIRALYGSEKVETQEPRNPALKTG